MKIWKWFGWDTKEARIEKNRHNNIHTTIQTAIWAVAIVLAVYGCSALTR